MDAPTNFSLIQLILVWTLLGFLLTWMVVFAVLAVRSRSHLDETLAYEDIDAPSMPLPAISILPKPHKITAPSLPSAAIETLHVEHTFSSEAMIRP